MSTVVTTTPSQVVRRKEAVKESTEDRRNSRSTPAEPEAPGLLPSEENADELFKPLQKNAVIYRDHQWHQDTNLDRISFRKKGRLLASAHFAHLIMDLEIDQLRNHTTYFCHHLGTQKTRPGEENDHALNYIRALLNRTEKECVEISREMQDAYDLWFTGAHHMQRGTQTHHRDKRQFFVLGALLAVGAIAAFSYLLSDTSLIDISVGSYTNPATITTLQDHENKVTIHDRDISILNATLAEVVATEEAGRNAFERLLRYEAVRINFDELREKVRRVVNGLKMLHLGRLSDDIVDPKILTREVAQLRREILAMDFKLVAKDIEEIYKSDVSYMVFSNGTIRMIIHLPMYREESVFTLYEFVALPYPFGDGHFMKVRPDKQILAIDDRHDNFKDMTFREFSLCQKIGHLYVCKHENAYARATHSSCLFSLFKRDVREVRERCELIFSVKSDQVIQVSNTEAMVYHSKPRTARLDCIMAENHGDEINFQGFKTFYVQPGCRVITPDFVVEGSIELFFEADEVVQTDFYMLNDHILPELAGTLTTNLMDKLSLVGSAEGLKFRDIQKLIKEHETSFHFKVGLISGIGFLLVVGMCAYLYCACCRGKCDCCQIRRTRKQPKQRPPRPPPPTVRFKLHNTSQDPNDDVPEDDAIEMLPLSPPSAPPVEIAPDPNRASFRNPSNKKYNKMYPQQK